MKTNSLGLAFKICELCAGMGFLQKGSFADRKFIQCETCKGLGQQYLEQPAKQPLEVIQ